MTGREPVMTLAERLAEDAARPEQAAATIDALLRLKLARWHFELARPPEPAELALGQLTGIEAADPNWDAVERELGRAALEAAVAEEGVALADLERAVAKLVTTSSARCSGRCTARSTATACSSTSTAAWS